MKLRNTFEIFLSNVKLGQVVEFGNDVQKVVSVHDTTFEEATGNSDIIKTRQKYQMRYDLK